MTNSISKGKIYQFKGKNGLLKGIFEGKVISYNSETIIQIRDIKDSSILYNIKIDILEEIWKKKN